MFYVDKINFVLYLNIFSIKWDIFSKLNEKKNYQLYLKLIKWYQTFYVCKRRVSGELSDCG